MPLGRPGIISDFILDSLLERCYITAMKATKTTRSYQDDFLGHGFPERRAIPRAHQYDTADLPGLGWIVITEHGAENTYFTLADGSVGFVKVCG